ncbi:MAG: hypothetical protein KJ620_03640 [Candidatus Edwardsbacteria bacterium]|nr:hypothetical protein [Candidatus Edwardsbacteria bacterium]MBU1575632.1 hypothetical protein [Candidatus Edwardsbacteria bacterium]MBU2463002.1 hypothetical protein [Candidatus Edwardsbacteria bacterium]MBU2594587.1 hypothetical protein [Candidatus Edwardsbacteria bacterium]
MKHASHFLNQDMMGEHINEKIYNAVAVITVAGIVAVTLTLLVLTIIGKA